VTSEVDRTAEAVSRKTKSRERSIPVSRGGERVRVSSVRQDHNVIQVTVRHGWSRALPGWDVLPRCATPGIATSRCRPAETGLFTFSWASHRLRGGLFSAVRCADFSVSRASPDVCTGI